MTCLGKAVLGILLLTSDRQWLCVSVLGSSPHKNPHIRHGTLKSFKLRCVGKNYFSWLYLVIVTPLSFSPVKNKPNHIFSMMVLSISNYLLQTWRILNRGSEHRSVVSDSLLLQARVHSLSFLHGIFPTQGSNPGLPHCGWILYQWSHQGTPRILEWVAYPFSSGSSWPRNQTGVSCIAGRFFTNWAMREAQFEFKHDHKGSFPSDKSFKFW